MKEVRSYNKCRACHSNEINILYKFQNSPLEDLYLKKKNLSKKDKLYPMVLIICNSCKYVHLKHTIDPDLSYKNYIYETSTTSGLKKHYDLIAEKEINKFNLNNSKLIVDIGSNDGSFLSSFKSKGMKVLGIEPAKNISSLANKKGIPTINSYFNQNTVKKIIKKYGKAYHITANYVFANIADINDFIISTKILLSNQGNLVIETGYHPDQFKSYMFDYIYHEHYSYFTVTFLDKFLRKNGLYINDFLITKPKGGSIKIYIKKINKNIRFPSKVLKLINIEKINKIHTKKYYNQFFDQINLKKIELLNYLKTISKKKLNIIGFGASHSVTTLIYNFNLSKYIKYIVDDNKIKYDTYSPGYKIPVFSSKKLYQKRNSKEIILILAWQHSNVIINKHKSLLKKNIEFVIPLPQLKIINDK
tara:strand:- start:200 stop:1453 length:1254 start_codon:yes stop_codon:yes gene_type:complete